MRIPYLFGLVLVIAMIVCFDVVQAQSNRDLVCDNLIAYPETDVEVRLIERDELGVWVALERQKREQSGSQETPWHLRVLTAKGDLGAQYPLPSTLTSIFEGHSVPLALQPVGSDTVLFAGSTYYGTESGLYAYSLSDHELKLLDPQGVSCRDENDVPFGIPNRGLTRFKGENRILYCATAAASDTGDAFAPPNSIRIYDLAQGQITSVATAQQTRKRRPWFNVVAGDDGNVYMTFLTLAEMTMFPELEVLSKEIDSQSFDQNFYTATFDPSTGKWALRVIPFTRLQAFDLKPAYAGNIRLLGVDSQGNLYLALMITNEKGSVLGGYYLKVDTSGSPLWAVPKITIAPPYHGFISYTAADQFLFSGWADKDNQQPVLGTCQVK